MIRGQCVFTFFSLTHYINSTKLNQSLARNSSSFEQEKSTLTTTIFTCEKFLFAFVFCWVSRAGWPAGWLTGWGSLATAGERSLRMAQFYTLHCPSQKNLWGGGGQGIETPINWVNSLWTRWSRIFFEWPTIPRLIHICKQNKAETTKFHTPIWGI